MKVGSKETLECRAYSSRGVIRTTTFGHTSLMYGIGRFETIARSTPPRRCGEEKATHIPTLRCFRRQTFNHDVPLRGAQSSFFNFQLEKPDRKSSPLLPILPFSKAGTRCVHCMGAPFFSTHAMRPPEKGSEPDTAVKHLNRFRRIFGRDGRRVPQSALFVAIRYLCRGDGWLKSLPEER